MEQKEKNSVTTVLFIVGGFFIAVAAILFATTAWRSFTQGAKDITLMLATLIGFASSWLVRYQGRLQKTATVLYYLASVFLGLFVYAVFDHYLTLKGLFSEGNGIGCFPVFIAHVSMVVAIAISLLRYRRLMDVILFVILVDLSYFWGGLNYILDIRHFSIFLFIFGLIQFFYTIAIIKEEVWNPDLQNGLHIGAYTCYLLHIAVYGIMLMINWCIAVRETAMFLNEYQMNHQIEMFETLGFLVNVSLIVLMICLLYQRFHSEIIRVFQSLSMLMLIQAIVLTGQILINFCAMKELREGLACFLCYVLCCCLLVVFPRIELLLSTSAYCIIMVLAQMASYNMQITFSSIAEAGAIYPYEGVFLITFLIVLLRCYQQNGVQLAPLLLKDNQDVFDNRQMLMFRIKGCFGILFALVALLFYYTGSLGKCIVFFYAAFSILFVACQLRGKRGIKQVLYTLVLCNLELAFLSQDFMEIPRELITEWYFLLIASFVIAICKLYSKVEDIALVQFVCLSCLVALLLLRDIVFGELLNALVLGVIGIGIMLYGVFKNYRCYVVLAGVVLICLALYLTRSFWLSISWWVYLFFAGILLVALAIKKERESKE